MSDKKEKIEKFLAEVKDEGLNFFKYFRSVSGYEKAAIIAIVGLVFLAGALIF